MKHDTHNFQTTFKGLSCLTSLLLPAGESTTDTVYNVKIHSLFGYIPLVIILGARSLLIFSFKPRPLYSRSNWMVSYMCSISYWHASGKRKSLWESKQDFSVSQPVPCSPYWLCCPATIVNNFVIHTVAEALYRTAFNSKLHFMLDFKTVSGME
jgi:hypothetical protein